MAFLRLVLLMHAHAAVYIHGLQSSLQSSPHKPPADTPGNVQKMPWRGKVAVILRGQTFRSFRSSVGCEKTCRESQLNSSRSVVSQLIEPLERVRENSVDVFNVDCGDEPCEMIADENRALSAKQWNQEETRNIQSTFVNSHGKGGQAICVQRALDFFETSVDPSTYDTIIMIRHDIEWLDSIFSWSGADFTGVNFFSRCEFNAVINQGDGTDGPTACVNDLLHMVPGHLYKAWRAEIGKDKCFSSEWQNGHGHMCWNQTVLAAGGEHNVHLATPWFPRSWLREESSFLRFKACSDEPALKYLRPDQFNENGTYKWR
eukprot:TRINITY_DN1570_c0_g1_i1.p1 TRINITY_DN1570_c0_g1~~TRINITY_DN1570_c0_g1_i1.p1  ORF type:complete len:333 (+),score=35.64 TRINITY_DN1570_c0_g1_i1:49-999(+)